MSKLNLEQLKKRAKELVRDHAAGSPEAIAFIRAHHPHELAELQLSDAQWAIARSLGASSWPALVHQLAQVPLVPVRNIVVFPGQRLALNIGRARSKAALAAAHDSIIALVAQRTAQTEDPGRDDLHDIGTLARVLSTRPASAQDQLLAEVEGMRRVRLVRIDERDGALFAETTPIDTDTITVDPEVAKRAAIVALDAIAKQLPPLPDAALARALMLPHMALLPPDVQQRVLETDDPVQWIAALSSALSR